MDTLQQQALNVLTSSKLLRALDLNQEPAAMRARHGTGETKNQSDGAPLNLKHLPPSKTILPAPARRPAHSG